MIMNGLRSEPPALEARILDNLTSAVLLFGSDMTLRYMNAAAEILFETSARKLVGTAASDLLCCQGDQLIEHVNQATSAGHPFTEREIRLGLVNGGEKVVDCTAIPLSERDGDAGVLIEVQQVDRHLRINREEQLLNQQQVARELIRGLAHEIKNPLGGLRGAAQLLEGELADDGLREYTAIIIGEADRLQTLVNRLLGPNNRPDYRSVEIHAVLERVRTLVLAEAGPGLELRRDYDPSIPAVVGDEDQLIQAVLNIVRNGARALGNKGRMVLRTRVRSQFTIGNTRHRLVAQIEIEDDGPGVPEEIKERLFYPMVTSGTGGMGLGLSIAQTLVNQHHGLIECQSEPGQTIFTIYLPLE